MIRYVNVVRCLSHNKGKRIIKLEAELADCKKREKFLVVVVALLVVIFAILCLLR